jgi:tRNA A-37 threonylcarbamoyl transferase component Bud32
VALVPGSSAGPYRIVEPLGRGGMASVYKAYESKLDRYVALKVLPREFLHDPNFAQRFRQEARVIARLEHPNIIPIYAYDIDEQDGIPWMAMRLLKAGSLADLLKRERLARGRGVAILRGTADALDYAHGQGIVHRDVKPQNVLLDESGRVYLADFGIAKILESSGGLTASGMITGTPQYMAPEQATGLKIGPAADVYALGIVAYEMLTGRVPFSADTPVAVLMKHVQEPLPLPPLDVVPEPMLRALLKATAKKPEDRWPTAGAFVAGLSAGLDAPIAITSAPTVAIPRRPWSSRSRRPLLQARRPRCRRAHPSCVRLPRGATRRSPRCDGRRCRRPFSRWVGSPCWASWRWRRPGSGWRAGARGLPARRAPRRRRRRPRASAARPSSRRQRPRPPAKGRRRCRSERPLPRRPPLPIPRPRRPRDRRPRPPRRRLLRCPSRRRRRPRPSLPRPRSTPRSSGWRHSSPIAMPRRGDRRRRTSPRGARRRRPRSRP